MIEASTVKVRNRLRSFDYGTNEMTVVLGM